MWWGAWRALRVGGIQSHYPGGKKGQRPRLSSKCRELCRPLFPPSVGCASTPVNLPHARSWLHPHRSGVRQSEWSTINNNPRLRDHQTLLHTAVAAAVAFASLVVSVLFFHPVNNCCSLFLALPHASPVDNSLPTLPIANLLPPVCRCPALCRAAKIKLFCSGTRIRGPARLSINGLAL